MFRVRFYNATEDDAFPAFQTKQVFKMKSVVIRCVCFLALLTQAQAQTHHHSPAQSMQASVMPLQAGQSAFAAIAEIVSLLEKDFGTDWTKVNIEGLRQHLIDMDQVTLHSEVKSMRVNDGMKFMVTGTGPVQLSIQRMLKSHAATMDGVDGWHFKAEETANGADLTVTVPYPDQNKLIGLGFIGVMTRGMHHQAHHLAIARGIHPPH